MGAARLSWATLSYIFVAQGCSTARLSDTFVHLRRPRVQHGTLGQHFRTSSSPEGAARHAWATLSYIFVARGCSTARLGDTSARFRRPKVLGKRRKVESDKKRRSLPKTRETSVGCPKPGSNRHVFKGHWILSPTRLPIPPFGHIQAVDFPLETSHFRCTSAALPLQRSAKLLNFLRYSKTFNNSLREKNVNFLMSGKKDLYRINTAVDASYPVESRLAGQTAGQTVDVTCPAICLLAGHFTAQKERSS